MDKLYKGEIQRLFPIFLYVLNIVRDHRITKAMSLTRKKK